uniref:Uncharacterized protein n=1 Tax=Rhizophora mucronata TaxID=61149 RepID=A0A2P2Q1F0_RHIMU
MLRELAHSFLLNLPMSCLFVWTYTVACAHLIPESI